MDLFLLVSFLRHQRRKGTTHVRFLVTCLFLCGVFACLVSDVSGCVHLKWGVWQSTKLFASMVDDFSASFAALTRR